MIDFNSIYAETEKAFKNNEFYELLLGLNNYNVNAPASVPTDWTLIIYNGIFELYKHNTNQQEAIKIIFYDAIKKLINGNEIELWVSSYIIFLMLHYQMKNKAPFTLSNEILNLFKSKLSEMKDQLSANKKYEGSQYSNGLYGDIERLNNTLKIYYSIDMIN